MKKKILITGSGGFIGRNVKEYLETNYTVFAPRSKDLNLLDYLTVENYLRKNKFDEVIHAAVYHVTRNSDKDPHLNLSHNLRMFFNLANCNKLYKRMFHFGSGAEFGKQHPIQSVSEKDFGKRIPEDDYGFFKYIIMKSLPSYPNIYNLRLFGIFGKYEDWEIRFISHAICKVIFGMDITMKQNVYFDYLYIKDLLNIVDQFLKKKSIPYQTINVCTGKKVDILKLARIIKKISKKDVAIKVDKSGFNKEYTAKNKRLLKILPNIKFTPIEKSIKDLYLWYSNNSQIIDKKRLLADK